MLNAKNILERYKKLKGLPITEEYCDSCDNAECKCEPKPEGDKQPLNDEEVKPEGDVEEDDEEVKPGEPEVVMEKLSLKDDILAGITLEELLDTVHSNVKDKNAKSVMDTFEMILKKNMEDAQAILKKEMPMILNSLK